MVKDEQNANAKRTKTTVNKLIKREKEKMATEAWDNLSPEEKAKWQKFAPKNVKLILLSASPMINEPSEIVDLINLLRLNKWILNFQEKSS